MSSAGLASADVALEPEDEVRIAETIIREKEIPCGVVLNTLPVSSRDRERFIAMGYRRWFVASCQNGARVVIATGWRRSRPRPAEPTYVRVLPRTRR